MIETAVDLWECADPTITARVGGMLNAARPLHQNTRGKNVARVIDETTLDAYLDALTEIARGAHGFVDERGTARYASFVRDLAFSIDDLPTVELHRRLLRGLVLMFESATRGTAIRSYAMHCALVALASIVRDAPDRLSLMRDYLSESTIPALLQDTLVAARKSSSQSVYDAALAIAMLFGIAREEIDKDETA